jgi:WD40 repeat protein
MWRDEAMKIGSRGAVIVAAYAILAAAAACAPTPSEQPVGSSPSQETTATASIPSGSLTPTRTKYPTRTRPYTQTATPTITTLVPEASILPGWVPEGALARLTGLGEIHDLEASPADSAVAVSSDRGTYLYSQDFKKVLWALPDGLKACTVAFSRDGSVLATGMENGDILLWNQETMEIIRTIKIPAFLSCPEMLFAADGITLTAGSREIIFDSLSVELWYWKAGKRIRSTQALGGNAIDFDFSPDGRHAAFIALDSNRIGIWDIVQGKMTGILDGHEWYVSSVAFSHTGKELLSSDGPNVILWSFADGRILKSWNLPGITIIALEFSRDGEKFAAGATDGRIVVWEKSRMDQPRFFDGEGSEVRELAFSADGTTLISSSRDRSILAWDISGN